MTSAEEPKRKEIYTFGAPWLVYTLAWNRSGLPTDRFKLAVGSFKEEYSNEIKILQLQHVPLPAIDPGMRAASSSAFTELSRCDHPYPATKILWAPQQASSAASGKGTSIFIISTATVDGNQPAYLLQHYHLQSCWRPPATTCDSGLLTRIMY
jgi:hypothetical protein